MRRFRGLAASVARAAAGAGAVRPPVARGPPVAAKAHAARGAASLRGFAARELSTAAAGPRPPAGPAPEPAASEPAHPSFDFRGNPSEPAPAAAAPKASGALGAVPATPVGPGVEPVLFPWEKRQLRGGSELTWWEKLYWAVFVLAMALVIGNRTWDYVQNGWPKDPSIAEAEAKRRIEVARNARARALALDAQLASPDGADPFDGLEPAAIEGYVTRVRALDRLWRLGDAGAVEDAGLARAGVEAGMAAAEVDKRLAKYEASMAAAEAAADAAAARKPARGGGGRGGGCCLES